MTERKSAEKRVVKVTLGVFYATVSTGWNQSALILEDNSGDVAPRKVTLRIERPSDIEYIRERLQQIEDAWRKELDSLKVTT
jgi:uncharacterized membrane protein